MEFKIGDRVKLKNPSLKHLGDGVIVGIQPIDEYGFSKGFSRLNILKGSLKVKWENGVENIYDSVQLIKIE